MLVKLFISLTRFLRYVNYFQIIVGGGSNTNTEVRQEHYQPGEIYETPNILRENEFVGFWVRFKFGKIDIGREDEVFTTKISDQISVLR